MTREQLREVIGAIEGGAAGPGVGAMFDLDGTLVSGFTGSAFYKHQVREGEVGPDDFARLALLVADAKLGGDQARLGDQGMAGLRGTTEEDLEELGERLFVQKIAATIRPQAREIIGAHRRMGHTVAIASSATGFQVGPVARDLGVEHVLCSRVEVQDGLLTGRFDGGMLWGEAKARAVRGFGRDAGLDLGDSYAYANGDEDVAFLSSVGRPHAVNPQRGLRRVAEGQHWPILTLDDLAGPSLRTALATVAAIGGLNAGLGIGLGIGLLRRDRRLGADLACGLAFDSFLSLVGVRLRVTGEEHLWKERPAVFVMNHQSGLDAIIVGALVRRGLSGLSKKEARYGPATFLLGHALEAVFVDRGDPEAGRRSQEELIERLRSGLSVFVAPEGTRTPTPVLTPFRTGAFRVAMEAGVPVVPIVLRNAYDLMPGSAKTARPGVVDVAVLEPVSSKRWKPATVRAAAEDVRQRFADTLGHWPGEA